MSFPTRMDLEQSGDLPLTLNGAATVLGGGVAGTGVGFRPDCTGEEETVTATLSATPWTVLSPRLAVPDFATSAVITAPAAVTKYRLNGDPSNDVAGAGATLQPAEQRVIGLAAGTSRTLGLVSAGASAVVVVEWLP